MTRQAELQLIYDAQAQCAANVLEGQGAGAVLGLADFVMEEVLIILEERERGWRKKITTSSG